MNHRFLKRGFTLIELLLVIGIIAILAAIVIVAINPTKQLGDARNAQRRSDVNTILNAVYQYSIDNNGNLPTTITTGELEICDGTGACGALVDLAVLTTNGKYLVAIPTDPSRTSADITARTTKYTIQKDATTGRVTVKAPNGLAETSPATITVTR